MRSDRLRRCLSGVVVSGMLGAAPAAAQESWEAPTFFAPRSQDELGVYLTIPDDGAIGIAGIWRQTAGIHLGVRGGIGGRADDRTVLIGAELFGPLSINALAPLAAWWVTGVGASIDGSTMLRVPVGLSIGTSIVVGRATITPYVHPRLAFDLTTFQNESDDDATGTALHFGADIGIDLQLGARYSLRAGYAAQGPGVLGIGTAIRLGRPVTTR